MTYDNFTWKNLLSILIGMALTVFIFLSSFVLPAHLEYKLRPETSTEDMHRAFVVYTIISGVLFYLAIKLNLWFKKESTFGEDILAIAIGLNSIPWGFMFIASL